MKVGTTDVIRLYIGLTEVTYMKDNNDNPYHKRVTLTFNANGGTGGSSQTRTWDVENVTQPSNPSRSGHSFLGWATTSGATAPNISFPFIAPLNNTTYYAVWEEDLPATVAPSFATQSVGWFNTMEYRVRHNDSAGAGTILADGNNPPTTSRGSIAYQSWTNWITLNCNSGQCNTTVYATAQVSGRDKSSVASVYVS